MVLGVLERLALQARGRTLRFAGGVCLARRQLVAVTPERRLPGRLFLEADR